MTASSPPPPVPPSSRWRLGAGAAIVVVLVVLSAAVGWGLLRGQDPPSASLPLSGPDAGPSAGPTPLGGEIYVHVLGSVEHPGLYVLAPGARLVDAVAAAGGTTANADLAAVNLARVLADGEQVPIPAVGARPASGAPAAPDDGVVDLNTADEGALESLPRIGPALAERIIAWRDEHGPFRSVDDLLAVPGIGEKLLSGLRDGVRV